MKQRLFQLIAFIAAIIAAISCEEESSPVIQPESLVVPKASAVSAAMEGGIYMVRYDLDASVAGTPVQASCPDSWVHSFDLSEEGEVSFTVDWNETAQSRETEVILKLDLTAGQDMGGKSASAAFKVQQEQGAKRPKFTIEPDEIKESNVSAIITPVSNDIPYINICVSEKEYDAMGSDEVLFEKWITPHKEAAESQGISVADYLENIGRLYYGERTYTVESMQPETEYYLCAAWISSDGKLLDDMVKISVTTSPVQQVKMDFGIVYEISGPKVDMTVRPSLIEQRYVFDIVEKSTINIDNLVNLYQQEIGRRMETYRQTLGMNDADIVDKFIATKGLGKYSKELKSKTEYYGFAMAVNPIGIICSEPVVKEFVTGQSDASDNVISLDLPVVSDRQVTFSITASNDDQYVFDIQKASKFTGKTDEEILKEMTNGFYKLDEKIMSGSKTGNVRRLEPQTEYIALAFGYYGGKVTTSLVKKEFTTTAAVVGSATISLDISHYYDGTAMNQAYPSLFPADFANGKAVLPVYVTTDDNTTEYYYHIFASAPPTPDGYEEYIYDTLIKQGYSYDGGILYASYYSEYAVAAFAVDKDGHYGPIYWKLMTMTKSGVTPPDQYTPASAFSSSVIPFSFEGR